MTLSFIQPSLFFWMVLFSSFFFNDTATTEIYTLSLHDALPILVAAGAAGPPAAAPAPAPARPAPAAPRHRSEEHTSELQSQSNLVCRLLLEKKKERRWTSRAPRSKSPPSANAHPFSLPHSSACL